jgi:ABC-type microcin C transport system permease subunit YejB
MRKVWIIVPTLMLVVAIFFNVVSFASTGTVGSDLYAMGKKTEELREENKKLTKELAKSLSLQTVIEKAAQEGYIDSTTLTQVAQKSTQVAMEIGQ